jgi:hypothetical protein
MRKGTRNPFIIGHPALGDDLADRVDEVARIQRAFTDPSGRLLIYGHRRLGKSSIVGEAAARARKAKHPVIVVDLAKVTSVEGAAKAILDGLSKEMGRRWANLATSLVARFHSSRVQIGAQPDPTGGAPTVTFSVVPNEDASKDPGALLIETLDAVEKEAAARNARIGVALDEFQRLAHWVPKVDWVLKGVFDAHRRVAYVLAGSERSVIDAMIDDKQEGGLYKMVDVMPVGPIPTALFAPWIRARAASTDVEFDLVATEAIIAVGGTRTRDVMQLARRVWDATHAAGRATVEDVAAAMDELVREQSAHHEATWNRLKSDTHRRILVLVAHTSTIEVSASATLRRYHLGSKSTVTRILKALMAEEHIVRAHGAHYIDDPFFRRWIEVHAFREFAFPTPTLLHRVNKASA